MKIKELKINGFGNIENKEIKLIDGINIIYGKNESGKSTLLKFIHNMLYGTSKNKKGREISDYDKFKPWKAQDFSGKMKYCLDNGQQYEIYREFNKKNPKIFNDKLEDISKNYAIDKTKGIDFFYEQTHIDEELFLSSVMVMQQEVKLEKQEQNTLIQKIANLASSGDDSISYQKCVDKLSKKQLIEIGTNRSQDRPINKITQKIENLLQEKNKLNNYKNQKNNLEIEKEKINKLIIYLEEKNNLLREINNLNINKKIEKEKIKLNEEIKNNYEEKIKELNVQKREIENKKEEKNKKIKLNKINNKIYFIALFIIILINVISFVFISNIVKYLPIMLLPAITIIYFLQKNKINKINNKLLKEKENEINEIEKEFEKINNEINLIEKNKIEKEEEIKKINNEINIKNNLLKENINKKYFSKINSEEINLFLEKENINNYLEENQNNLNNEKIKLNQIQMEEKNIILGLDKLSEIEENIESTQEELKELIEKNKMIDFTKNILEKSYEMMRENVTPKFSNMLSNTIHKISNGKYKKVKLNTQNGIIVEREDGNYIPADLLSTGTIDQMYLSLRFATIKELAKERLPIILDESFAYYDKERLENTLQFIKEEMSQDQILIFTCTNREKAILEEINVSYQEIIM